MMVVIMKEENPEGSEGGVEMEASVASYPPSLQVLLPNLEGSGWCFSLEVGLLYALYWRWRCWEMACMTASFLPQLTLRKVKTVHGFSLPSFKNTSEQIWRSTLLGCQRTYICRCPLCRVEEMLCIY